MKTKPGFVLIIATLFIGTVIVLVSSVINRVNAYRRQSTSWIEIEKARMIALGGVQIAIGQLAQFNQQLNPTPAKPPKPGTDNTEKQEQEQKEAAHNNKKIVSFLFKKLNHWQTFDLKEKPDGIDATSYVYITSPQGTINLNQFYDPEKKQFKSIGSIEGRKVVQAVSDALRPFFEKHRKKPIALDKVIEELSSGKKLPLEDVSELLSFPSFKQWTHDNLFANQEAKDEPVLTDLFSANGQTGIYPLVASKSIQKLLGISISEKEVDAMPPDNLVAVLRQWPTAWESAWQSIAKVVGKEYQSFSPEIKALFASQFDPKLFYVVSYGKVGSVIQKVAVILEINTDTKTEKPFLIKKLYWV